MSGNNHLPEFTDQNFEEQVLKSDKPVLVDFWATWCGPCRAITPTVEAVAAEYAGRTKVGKVNVDDNMNVTSRYRITGIPALLLFKNGQVAEQLTGVQSKDTVVKMIERHL
jgi:thioredoxin 1